MDATAWKDIWTFVFYVASAMFYVTVTVVAIKGVGDVVGMIRDLLHARRSASS